MKNHKVSPTFLPSLLLRGSLALVFLYAAIASFVHPAEWVGYLPKMVLDHVDNPTLLLKVFSGVEIVVAALLISGLFVRYVALVAAILLGGIALSNVHLFIVTFRDVGLMLAALALAAMPKK